MESLAAMSVSVAEMSTTGKFSVSVSAPAVAITATAAADNPTASAVTPEAVIASSPTTTTGTASTAGPRPPALPSSSFPTPLQAAHLLSSQSLSSPLIANQEWTIADVDGPPPPPVRQLTRTQKKNRRANRSLGTISPPPPSDDASLDARSTRSATVAPVRGDASLSDGTSTTASASTGPNEAAHTPSSVLLSPSSHAIIKLNVIRTESPMPPEDDIEEENPLEPRATQHQHPQPNTSINGHGEDGNNDGKGGSSWPDSDSSGVLPPIGNKSNKPDISPDGVSPLPSSSTYHSVIPQLNLFGTTSPPPPSSSEDDFEATFNHGAVFMDFSYSHEHKHGRPGHSSHGSQSDRSHLSKTTTTNDLLRFMNHSSTLTDRPVDRAAAVRLAQQSSSSTFHSETLGHGRAGSKFRNYNSYNNSASNSITNLDSFFATKPASSAYDVPMASQATGSSSLHRNNDNSNSSNNHHKDGRVVGWNPREDREWEIARERARERAKEREKEREKKRQFRKLQRERERHAQAMLKQKERELALQKQAEAAAAARQGVGAHSSHMMIATGVGDTENEPEENEETENDAEPETDDVDAELHLPSLKLPSILEYRLHQLRLRYELENPSVDLLSYIQSGELDRETHKYRASLQIDNAISPGASAYIAVSPGSGGTGGWNNGRFGYRDRDTDKAFDINSESSFYTLTSQKDREAGLMPYSSMVQQRDMDRIRHQHHGGTHNYQYRKASHPIYKTVAIPDKMRNMHTVKTYNRISAHPKPGVDWGDPGPETYRSMPVSMLTATAEIGVGAYEHANNPKSKHVITPRLDGTVPRFDVPHDALMAPGPGAYSPRLPQSIPTLHIARSAGREALSEMHNVLTAVPGPDVYLIPSSVSRRGVTRPGYKATPFGTGARFLDLEKKFKDNRERVDPAAIRERSAAKERGAELEAEYRRQLAASRYGERIREEKRHQSERQQQRLNNALHRAKQLFVAKMHDAKLDLQRANAQITLRQEIAARKIQAVFRASQVRKRVRMATSIISNSIRVWRFNQRIRRKRRATTVVRFFLRSVRDRRFERNMKTVVHRFTIGVRKIQNWWRRIRLINRACRDLSLLYWDYLKRVQHQQTVLRRNVGPSPAAAGPANSRRVSSSATSSGSGGGGNASVSKRLLMARTEKEKASAAEQMKAAKKAAAAAALAAAGGIPVGGEADTTAVALAILSISLPTKEKPDKESGGSGKSRASSRGTSRAPSPTGSTISNSSGVTITLSKSARMATGGYERSSSFSRTISRVSSIDSISSFTLSVAPPAAAPPPLLRTVTGYMPSAARSLVGTAGAGTTPRLPPSPIGLPPNLVNPFAPPPSPLPPPPPSPPPADDRTGKSSSSGPPDRDGKDRSNSVSFAPGTASGSSRAPSPPSARDPHQWKVGGIPREIEFAEGLSDMIPAQRQQVVALILRARRKDLRVEQTEHKHKMDFYVKEQVSGVAGARRLLAKQKREVDPRKAARQRFLHAFPCPRLHWLPRPVEFIALLNKFGTEVLAAAAEEQTRKLASSARDLRRMSLIGASGGRPGTGGGGGSTPTSGAALSPVPPASPRVGPIGNTLNVPSINTTGPPSPALSPRIANRTTRVAGTSPGGGLSTTTVANDSNGIHNSSPPTVAGPSNTDRTPTKRRGGRPR